MERSLTHIALFAALIAVLGLVPKIDLASGVPITHVPYKGTGPAVADVISGIITMNFSSLPPAVTQVKAGNLKARQIGSQWRIAQSALDEFLKG